MSRIRQINEEYKNISSIRTLVSTYQEIASLRMRAVRDYVMQNRDYFDGISKVYNLVINSYKNEIINMSHAGKFRFDSSKNQLAHRRNGESLYVLLSANSALYGNIVQETFFTFLQASKEAPAAKIAVIGKVGKALMEEAHTGIKYEYFDLADTLDDTDNIKKIQEYLLKFENVVVFHGVFESILKQVPRSTYITGGSGGDVSVNKNVHYMFEPNLQEVLFFFENQIVSSSFIQSLNESYLSKYASRMVSLDVALTDIDKRIKNTQLQKQKIRHYVSNKKQQDLIAGRLLWNK
jgi:F0F1-type ATP synthase gamma subunit